MKKPKLGISGCLLGEKVRHDGGHAEDRWLTSVLVNEIEFKSYCPEVSMGLGTPRETVRIEYDKTGELFLKESKSRKDHTKMANNTFESILLDPALKELSGFILMRKSPTCAVEKVKHYNPENGRADRYGRGLFADALMKSFPNLPVIDSGRLKNSDERELFFRKVYAYKRFKDEVHDINDLIEFHASYKYILMEHSPKKLKELGRLTASSNGYDFKVMKGCYEDNFFKALSMRPDKGKKLNVLQHMVGYFKKQLSKEEKAEVGQIFDEFYQDKAPYLSSVNLIRFLARKYDREYLLNQAFFKPYPLTLR